MGIVETVFTSDGESVRPSSNVRPPVRPSIRPSVLTSVTHYFVNNSKAVGAEQTKFGMQVHWPWEIFVLKFGYAATDRASSAGGHVLPIDLTWKMRKIYFAKIGQN